MKVTVGNLKGGTAKTTTSVLLALLLSRTGRVALIDADDQGSASDWATNTPEWPAEVTVIPWAVPDLARRVQGIAADYAHIVIDTGPKDDATLRQALQVTEHLIVPTATTPLDIRRLHPTFALAAEVDTYAGPVFARVLLSKVRSGTSSAVESRASVEELGLPIFEAGPRLLEEYGLAWGTALYDEGDFAAVLAELQEADEAANANDD